MSYATILWVFMDWSSHVLLLRYIYLVCALHHPQHDPYIIVSWWQPNYVDKLLVCCPSIGHLDLFRDANLFFFLLFKGEWFYMHIVHPFYSDHSHKEEGHFSIFKNNFYLSVRLLIELLEMKVLANISLSTRKMPWEYF